MLDFTKIENDALIEAIEDLESTAERMNSDAAIMAVLSAVTDFRIEAKRRGLILGPIACEVCQRQPGYAPLNRFGEPDGGHELTPLGELQQCTDCGKWACPDCYCERECCHDEVAEVAVIEDANA